ncbi:MAG: pesticidal protein Cry7Aa [Flavobacteriales bacterium]|nr:pesticidal protein Cry7Aa [Flavobacteriales bacterium]MBK7268347.1 pesticidal protein Cry7Aa [Flavobacteriales bacterium]
MTLKIERYGVVLDKTDLGFENAGALNPACLRVGDNVHMFYRAVRHGNYSTVGHCLFNGPLEVAERAEKPLLIPEHAYESQGMEDPRIVKIEDTYYLTYTGYDRTNALGAYATSKDLGTFTKHGVITPQFTYRDFKKLIDCCPDLNPKYLFHYKMLKEHGLGEEIADKLLAWDKNLMFFPKKINGKFALLHRIHPGIQIVFFDDPAEVDRKFWEHYLMDLRSHIVMDPSLLHESSHIGGGAPPIETEDGWLLIYHSAEDTPHGFVYHACAALLDLKDPSKLIARLDHPLISPQEPYEKTGYVKNIVFPSGAVVFDDDLYIYYGAADERVAVASVKLPALLAQLKKTAR